MLFLPRRGLAGQRTAWRGAAWLCRAGRGRAWLGKVFSYDCGGLDTVLD